MHLYIVKISFPNNFLSMKKWEKYIINDVHTRILPCTRFTSSKVPEYMNRKYDLFVANISKPREHHDPTWVKSELDC